MVLGPPGHQIMYFWGKATDFCATDYTSGRPNNPVNKEQMPKLQENFYRHLCDKKFEVILYFTFICDIQFLANNLNFKQKFPLEKPSCASLNDKY